jgi:hypothetical protein
MEVSGVSHIIVGFITKPVVMYTISVGFVLKSAAMCLPPYKKKPPGTYT